MNTVKVSFQIDRRTYGILEHVLCGVSGYLREYSKWYSNGNAEFYFVNRKHIPYRLDKYRDFDFDGEDFDKKKFKAEKPNAGIIMGIMDEVDKLDRNVEHFQAMVDKVWASGYNGKEEEE